jgi:deoxyribonuclease V
VRTTGQAAPGAWPRDEAEALKVQDELRTLVSHESVGALGGARRVAGLDVAYAKDESVVAGAIAVIDPVTGEVAETSTATRPVEFPYIPGLLAFREVPALLDALDRLTAPPDVLVCDGYGIAHPRRFGLACHLGVLTGLPSFGVAKTAFVGVFDEPGPRRGDWSPLLDGSEEVGWEEVGRVLRTQAGVKPVFVSTGHRVGLDETIELTLRLATSYRLPETTRQADRLSRSALAVAKA